jgi:hypothetical protein
VQGLKVAAGGDRGPAGLGPCRSCFLRCEAAKIPPNLAGPPLRAPIPTSFGTAMRSTMSWVTLQPARCSYTTTGMQRRMVSCGVAVRVTQQAGEACGPHRSAVVGHQHPCARAMLSSAPAPGSRRASASPPPGRPPGSACREPRREPEGEGAFVLGHGAALPHHTRVTLASAHEASASATAPSPPPRADLDEADVVEAQRVQRHRRSSLAALAQPHAA